MEIKQKKCKDCFKVFPETREYFGSTGSGGFRNSCRECMRKRVKKWADKNPDKVKARWENRFKILKERGGPISEDIREAVYLKSGGLCKYCGKFIERNGEIEHKTPMIKGGSNDLGNLAWSCYQCNKEKANKTEKEYLRWRIKNNLPIFKI